MSFARSLTQALGEALAQPLTGDGQSTPAVPVLSSVSVTGNEYQGQTLTANYSLSAGYPAPTASYQWKRGVTNVGTDSSTYTLVAGDVGSTMTCVITVTNSEGSDNDTTAATGTIGVFPSVDTTVTISGTETVGSVLTIGGGTLIWMLGSLYYARSEKEAPIYLGIHTFLTGLRWAVAPFVGVLLQDLCGNNARPIFALSAVVILFTAVVMLREPPMRRFRRSATGKPPSTRNPPMPAHVFNPWRRPRRHSAPMIQKQALSCGRRNRNSPGWMTLTPSGSKPQPFGPN